MSDILVIDMNSRSIQCFLCGEWDEHRWGVPTCNGDVVSNDFPDEIWHEHGGGQAVCRECYEKHLNGLVPTFDRFYLHLASGFVGGAGI
jgi:hypothetical protein